MFSTSGAVTWLGVGHLGVLLRDEVPELLDHRVDELLPISVRLLKLSEDCAPPAALLHPGGQKRVCLSIKVFH